MAPRTLALTGFCDWPEGLPPAPGPEAPRARIAGYMRTPVRLAPAPQPECRYAFRHSISLAAPASTAAAAPVAEPAVAQPPGAPASPPPLQGELRADGAVPTGAPAIAAPGAAMAATATVAAAATATTATATEAAPAQPQAAEKPAVSTKKVVDPSVEPAIPVLELQDITKSFGENRANDGISLSLRPGEKHALLGENGAGKSTLVRIAYGMLQPDGGRVLIDGVGRRVESPAEARRHGIGMVFQHFSTFDALTVAENLAVALPDRGLGELRRGLREIGKTYGLQLDPHRRVGTLSAGEKQRLEIVRCLLQNPRVLILDEPTSVLAPQETDALFATLNRLSEEGVAILYISHRLEDVRRLCETATILRDGKVVAHCDPRETTAAALGEMMIGAATARPARRAAYVGAARLEVTGLEVPARDGGMALKDITFSARKGELLGIAGVAGEGQSELFAALSGEAPTRQHDAILFDGQPVGRFGPSRRRHFGAAFAPEQRLGHAAIPELRLSENLRLTLPRATVETARKIRETFSVAASGRDPFAGALSGGNLQKFVIGREISRQPGILIAEQPTWGVDVGSAAAIHEALMELRERKAAIVIISQDLDEIFALCDRVAVLHRGRLSEPRLVAEVTAEEIGLLMGGADPGQADAAEAGALLSESGSALHA